MSKARLLLDEMLSGAIAEQLRARGIDVLAVVSGSSLVAAPDDDLLVHAASTSRTLVTANITDFGAIERDWRVGGRMHAGIVYLAHRSFPQDQSFVGALVDSLAAMCERDAVPQPGIEIFLRRER